MYRIDLHKPENRLPVIISLVAELSVNGKMQPQEVPRSSIISLLGEVLYNRPFPIIPTTRQACMLFQ